MILRKFSWMFIMWMIISLSTITDADLIYLRDGRIIKGEIVWRMDNKVCIHSEEMELCLPEAEIIKVEKVSAVEESLQQARQLETQGKCAEALQIYAQALKSQPDNDSCKKGMNRCRDAIITKFKAAHRSLYDNNNYDALLKIIEAELSSTQQQAPVYNIFRELKAEVCLSRGKVYLNEMNYVAAEKEFKQATESADWLAEAWLRLGRTEGLLAKWDEARKALEKGLSLAPESASAKLYLALALYETKAINQGALLFLQVEPEARLDPNLTQDCLTIGRKFADELKKIALQIAQQGDNTQALSVYKKAMRYTPITVQSLQEAGQFYNSIGAKEEEREALSEARRLEVAGAALAAQRQAEARVMDLPDSPARSKSGRSVIRALSLNSALAKARSNNRKVLLIFCTDWCGYCKKLKREILPDSTVRKALGRYVVVELDAEKGEGKQLASRYGVSGYPTSFILDASGNEIDKMVGCPNPAGMAGWLNSH